VRKSSRPCENSAGHQFRGLRARRAKKIAKIRSPRDRTEHRIEFSHGLQGICRHDDNQAIAALRVKCHQGGGQ
jgi:hypothetical protein